MRNQHFLIVCFPAQGHINPSLQLAQRLLRLGNNVTFATTVFASRLMNKTHLISSSPKSFSFATFSDGFDNERFKPDGDVSFSHYFSELKRCGSESLTHLFVSSINEARPITFVIYSLLLNWAADVASQFNVPSSLIFVQPATLLALYYYYFNGYGDQISNLLIHNDPSSFLELPGLPLLFSCRDIPSFLSPSNPHAFLITPMKEQIQFLDKQTHWNVLVNTFDALEVEALTAMDHKLKIVPIGPLISSSSFGGGGDLVQSSNVEDNNYLEWLNSKPESSVVYISFGTICVLSDKQEEEVVNGLLESGYPFLWVIRAKEEEEKRSWKSKLEEKGGKIVSWCCQVQVLSHPSVGCFMTHCGWNSTIESLDSGVPVVAFPQQVDQFTNAKLIEDLWKTGVRVKDMNAESGIVEKEEIKRCLDMVMGGGGGGGEEIKRNAKHWKGLAKEAVAHGGSSDLNLKAFLTQIDNGCF